MPPAAPPALEIFTSAMALPSLHMHDEKDAPAAKELHGGGRTPQIRNCFSFLQRGLPLCTPVCWKCGIRELRRGARLHPGSGTRERAGAPSALHVNLNSCLGPIGSRTTWTGSHTMPQTIIGCDLSRDWLDVHALPEGKACRVANTRDDIAVWLAGLGPDP